MLYLIGLGLSFKELSVKSLEIIRKCDEIYLENYTSASNFSIAQLNSLVGKNVKVLNREQVELEKPFFVNAKKKKVALLVYGDVLSATTHIEILLDAKSKKIKTEIFHAPSILTTIAETGLSLYKFGKIGSIPFWEKNFHPDSFFDILVKNQKIGAHTLFLLDLRPEKNKFMTIKQAIELLLKIAMSKNSKLFNNDTHCIACSQLGTSKQIIKKGTAKELQTKRFGVPACLIIPSKISDYEMEALNNLIN
jgi:diphthine synthase